jgi:beta-galactosidase
LVENSGRINYGGKLPDNHKGILGGVTLDGKPLTGWQCFRMPLNSVKNVHFVGSTNGPSFYSGKFKLTKTGDGYFDLRGWVKGDVWVNGHALGRYWSVGPQQTLYVPSVWLKKGENTVTVFDLLGGQHDSLVGSPKPILTELHKSKAENSTQAGG